jgi:opacity protein-like surface antigen
MKNMNFKKTLIASLVIASTFSALAGAAELPKVGTFNAGAQVSFGNIDHKSFNNDEDGTAQVMFFVDYYFKPGWAIEVGVNNGTNVQDWICDQSDIDTEDDYCVDDDASDSDSATFESDLDFTNYILAVRFDKQVSTNSFVYGKLGAQYFDYEMTENSTVFEEDTGTGIYSELGWKYQWSNSMNASVGYQHIGMGDLSTNSITLGVGYSF